MNTSMWVGPDPKKKLFNFWLRSGLYSGHNSYIFNNCVLSAFETAPETILKSSIWKKLQYVGTQLPWQRSVL